MFSFHSRHSRAIFLQLTASPHNNPDGENLDPLPFTSHVTIAKVSKATATRDLQHLVEIGALEPVGAGRSTRCQISLDGMAANEA